MGEETDHDRRIEHERRRLWDSFDPNNPSVQILLLSQRVDALTREKEGLERDLEQEREERDLLSIRVSKIEGSLGKGAGILIGLSVVGTAAGVIAAYGKSIFAPWVK